MYFTLKVVLLIAIIIGFASLKTYITNDTNIKENLEIDNILAGVQKTGSEANKNKKKTDETIEEDRQRKIEEDRQREIEKERRRRLLLGLPVKKENNSDTTKKTENTSSEQFTSISPAPYEKERFTSFYAGK